MPRQARQASGTGIYHVMMRGINHQNIFEEQEDYYQFIATFDRMRVHYDEDGSPSGINCTYYAYCLMSNHFHLRALLALMCIIITGSTVAMAICSKNASSQSR